MPLIKTLFLCLSIQFLSIAIFFFDFLEVNLKRCLMIGLNKFFVHILFESLVAKIINIKSSSTKELKIINLTSFQ